MYYNHGVYTHVYATIQFPHDTEQCLGQLVECQCTVDGTGAVLVLTWRILDNNGIEIDSQTYTSGFFASSVHIIHKCITWWYS